MHNPWAAEAEVGPTRRQSGWISTARAGSPSPPPGVLTIPRPPLGSIGAGNCQRPPKCPVLNFSLCTLSVLRMTASEAMKSLYLPPVVPVSGRSQYLSYRVLESCSDPKVSLPYILKTAWQNIIKNWKHLLQKEASDFAKFHFKGQNTKYFAI